VRSSKRKRLETLVKYCIVLVIIAFLYTLIDFAVDIRPSSIQSSYRFELRDIASDQARVLRQDNLAILVIKRSEETIARLMHPVEFLQDPESAQSRQPEFARNRLRSSHPAYFVSYAIGTDLGCPLTILEQELGEACGPARYDFAGRALTGKNEFPNLVIPDYNFANDFSTLTIRP